MSVLSSSVTVSKWWPLNFDFNVEKGRNHTGIDLGCRGNVEGWEYFSSPGILKLKALCDLARYHGAAPTRLQCPFGLAGPVFEVVPRHLCRRRD
jgi:hypothetical protein